MMRIYMDDSPGIKVDPVVVLVGSLTFIASVFILHIGKQSCVCRRPHCFPLTHTACTSWCTHGIPLYSWQVHSLESSVVVVVVGMRRCFFTRCRRFPSGSALVDAL
ncbi:Sec61beta family-domain-containing protein [Entophlyctis helioformis]|nr:Sec61beta family-domain-containing protein [Entophlyctis helioformis]